MGGILVIALFYGHGISVGWLLIAATLLLGLFTLNRAYVRNGLVWTLGGASLWFALHHGGVHPTIAGVILGLMIPAEPLRLGREVLSELHGHLAKVLKKPADEELDQGEILQIEERLEDLESPLSRFVHVLHPFVAFGIMPLFALVNSGVPLGKIGWPELTGSIALGSALGLFFGKQLGIFAFTAVAVKLGLAPVPGSASWPKLYGVAIIAGIGFTVALFIGQLAFPSSPELLDQAKVGILLGSLFAGAVGSGLLLATRPVPTRVEA
jgi:NhaA family Na+:H+ antiporter